MLAVDGWPWESLCPGLWPGWREQELMPSAMCFIHISVLFSPMLPPVFLINPVQPWTPYVRAQKLYTPTVPQHQVSEPLLVHSLVSACPDMIDKIDYFRICQNVEILCIFRSVKCNCLLPSDSVLMLIVSIFIKTTINYSIWYNPFEKLWASFYCWYRKYLTITVSQRNFNFFITSAPSFECLGICPEVYTLKIQRNSVGCFLVPRGCSVAQGGGPRLCVCGDARVLQAEGLPSPCSHCRTSRSGPNCSVQLQPWVWVASAHWMGSKCLSHCHSSAGEVVCPSLCQLYLKAFFSVYSSVI